MFRLFKAELKKIFLKPSIFVVTALIILMLAVSTFIYTPSTKDEYAIEYDSSFKMVKEYYTQFTSGTDASKGLTKDQMDNLLNKAEAYVINYQNKVDTIAELKQIWSNIHVLFNQGGNTDYDSKHLQWASETDPVTKNNLKVELESKRNEIYSAINDFSQKYEDYSGRETITFLVTNDLDYKIVNEHLETINHIFKDWSANIEDKDGYIINEINSRGLFKAIHNDLDGLLTFEPSEDVINKMSTTKLDEEENIVENESSPIVVARKRLVEIANQVESVYARDTVSTNRVDIEEMMQYINNYYATVNYARDVVIESIKVSGLQKYSALDISKYKQFASGSNLYEMQEKLAKANYLYNTETYAYEYADPFSVIQPSNREINGFDYSYFALRLCTFFITIYIVVLAAGTIAGEQSAGTLKLLAIRPYSRNKLLSAKILATLAIGAILIFVSSIASLVIGGVTYGFNFTNILVIFNASSAVAMSPVLVYIIAMFTMFAEVAFYAVVSVFISTMLKSNVASVAISILIFFVSLVLNVVAINVPLLGLIPFVNVNLFKYFGSSFLAYASQDNMIQNILTPGVFSGSNFWTSLLLYSITFIIVTLVTHIVFKKRDIK